MVRMKSSYLAALVVFGLMQVGCGRYYVIPESLDSQVDRTITFPDLKRNPEAYKGKTVVLGGLVMEAGHLKEGTRIQVLELPLDAGDRPDGPLEASQGRFLLLDPDHHDPAVLKNRRITIVGEVLGQRQEKIEEFEYPFPYLRVRFVYIWPEQRGHAYAYYPYPYYPDPYFYGYPPYGFYPYYYPYPYPYPYVRVPVPSQPPERKFDSPSDPGTPPPSGSGGKSDRKFKK